MREIGALAALFVPLDSMFAERPLESGALIAWVAASLTMIACGILLVAKHR